MEAAIEETLFGASEAISPIILSMRQVVSIQDARDALESFYKAHQDQLSAVYCLSGRRQGKRIISVVLAQDIEAEKAQTTDATCVLYAVAPANANDEVVLSGLALQRSQLAITLSNEQLAKTGRILNPLNSHEAATTPPAPAPAPVPAPVSEPVSEPVVEEIKPQNPVPADIEPKKSEKEPKPPKTSTSGEPNSESKPKTTETATKRKREPPKTAGISSFFSKGSKTDALKATTRELPLKAASTVVVADDIQDDEDEEAIEPSKKKIQYESLRGMFDNEPHQAEPLQEASQEEQDIDVAGELQDVEESLQDSVMADDQGEPVNEEIEQPAEPMEEIAAEPNEDEDVPMEEIEQPPETSQEPSQEPFQEPESVQESKEPQITQAELDDGWSVSEYVAPTAPAKKDPPKPKAVPKPAAKPAISLPKIPAKPGKKQQSTLTSFFGKK